MPNSLFRSHEAEGGRNDQRDLQGTSKEKQLSMKAADPDVLLHTKPSLQRIPQYIEVPPNIEAKKIVSYFPTVLYN
jgi:hypothetical protein